MVAATWWVVDPAAAATSVTHVRHAWSSERAVVGRTHAPQFIARKRVAVDVPRRERPPAQAPVEPPREVRRVYSWRVRARRVVVLLPRDAPPSRGTAAPRHKKATTTAARVAPALPFVGPRLPPFFKAFARSCGNAIGAVDVLLLLSDPDAVPVEARNSRPPWLPDNVHFVKVGANRFARLHARIPYPRARQIYPGDEDIDERGGSL